MDKSKIYLDLSKCTEDERKSLPQIIKNGGDEVPFQMVGDFYNKDFPYLCFLTHLNYPIWDCCRNAFDLTELTYPEFIKLFECGESKEVLQVDIYSGELNTERILTYKKLSEQYNIEESTVRYIFNAGAEWVNKLNSNQ
mgnify:CR=1 FL=1